MTPRRVAILAMSLCLGYSAALFAVEPSPVKAKLSITDKHGTVSKSITMDLDLMLDGVENRASVGESVPIRTSSSVAFVDSTTALIIQAWKLPDGNYYVKYRITRDILGQYYPKGAKVTPGFEKAGGSSEIILGVGKPGRIMTISDTKQDRFFEATLAVMASR